jgi:hypothetical protein
VVLTIGAELVHDSGNQPKRPAMPANSSTESVKLIMWYHVSLRFNIDKLPQLGEKRCGDRIQRLLALSLLLTKGSPRGDPA